MTKISMTKTGNQPADRQDSKPAYDLEELTFQFAKCSARLGGVEGQLLANLHRSSLVVES